VRMTALVLCSMFLASCGRTPRLALSSYKSLYSFKGGGDGGYPYAGLTALNGTLYGTTYGGGGSGGWGTVFKVSTSGKERVIYRFKAGADGAHPYAGLIALNGTLCGTTYQGGTSGWGTVFKVSTLGKEHVLYSFKGGADGAYPHAGLTALNGILYGTTYAGGGLSGWGTVFKVSMSGTEHVLYRFKAGADGAHPYAGLIAVNGTLYGTTYQGGIKGWGTVFNVSTSGEEHVFYSFEGGADGGYPYAGVTNVADILYGTTYAGGASSGWGTVFTSGEEIVFTSGNADALYRFKADADGAHPYAGLIALNGTLYGTTYQGGASGWGTVFKLSTSGEELVLYSFKAGKDGGYPYAGLTALNGALYGTTKEGGSHGWGTVFRISP
jgi:uncharacterized repeat protein (TIGR03803 family)